MLTKIRQFPWCVLVKHHIQVLVPMKFSGACTPLPSIHHHSNRTFWDLFPKITDVRCLVWENVRCLQKKSRRKKFRQFGHCKGGLLCFLLGKWLSSSVFFWMVALTQLKVWQRDPGSWLLLIHTNKIHFNNLLYTKASLKNLDFLHVN